MVAERVTAQATATAATRPQPDRRDTEPQRLRRPGISPLGELLMQWLSFRRRRPRRRPPCPCKRPWTSSWQERPQMTRQRLPATPPAKFPTLPNRIANRALRATAQVPSRFLPAGRLLHLFDRCPGSRKRRHLSPILRDPWTVLPLQTDPESATGFGRWCVFAWALNWRWWPCVFLPEKMADRSANYNISDVPDRARAGIDRYALCIDYLTPAPLRKSDGDMPASLRNDLLKALSEPKPESMATRSTLASWCISSACA